MRATRVVMLSPAFDEDGCLPQGVEDFSVQQLVSELAVEGFVVTILPWRSGLDVERLHTDPAQPVADGMGGKLRAIVGSDMIGWTVTLEQVRQDGQHVVAPELALDMDRQAFPAVLVDHREHAEGFSVMSALSHEIVAPDMTTILRPKPHARSIIEPKSPSLRLFLRYLEPFATPDAFDPFGIHDPAVIAQQGRDPPVAVSAVLLSQLDDRCRQRLLIDTRLGRLPLGRTVLTNNPAGTAL